MLILWLIIGVYLVVGLVAVAIFEKVTGRIRRRLSHASDEARANLLNSGTYVKEKEGIALVLLATWIFWPALLLGATIKKGDK